MYLLIIPRCANNTILKNIKSIIFIDVSIFQAHFRASLQRNNALIVLLFLTSNKYACTKQIFSKIQSGQYLIKSLKETKVQKGEEKWYVHTQQSAENSERSPIIAATKALGQVKSRIWLDSISQSIFKTPANCTGEHLNLQRSKPQNTNKKAIWWKIWCIIKLHQ